MWESQAPKFFQYAISSQDASQRLETYVQRANLSSSLLYGQGSLNTTSSASSSSNSTSSGMSRRWGGVTFSRETDVLAPRQETTNDTQSGNVTVYGLSLLDDGTVVPVMKLGSVVQPALRTSTLSRTDRGGDRALQPYPRGLLTNVGMLVANPAYDPNTTKTDDWTAPRTTAPSRGLPGPTLWPPGWTASSPRATRRPTAPRWRNPAWRSGPIGATTGTGGRIGGCTEQAVAGHQRRIRGEFAEVWSWTWSNETERFSVTALGDISPEGTESDAIQLWTTVCWVFRIPPSAAWRQLDVQLDLSLNEKILPVA